jgi:hypothetical protein
MSTASDPFLAAISNSRQLSAEWAAELWQAHNFTTGVHLRAVHYILVSVSAVMGDGLPYENTNECQAKLGDALRDARYLGLINADAIIDQRNPEVVTHLVEPEDARLEVYPGAEFSQLKSAFPRNPCRRLYEPTIAQRYHVELWVEKSTQNEILEPLARRYKLNFFGGQGEVSLTRCTELIRRAERSNRPVRILYVSDFDPAGLSMPLTAARKLEFLIREEGLDIDLQVERICLTLDQCQQYNLPRTPIKEGEKRRDAFEDRYGRGATELDALGALYPGAMQEIVEKEIQRYYDPSLDGRVDNAISEYKANLDRINTEVEAKYADRLRALKARYDEVVRNTNTIVAELNRELAVVHREIAEELEKHEVTKMEWPEPGQGDEYLSPLLDSTRDYVPQLNAYKAYQDKLQTHQRTRSGEELLKALGLAEPKPSVRIRSVR